MRTWTCDPILSQVPKRHGRRNEPSLLAVLLGERFEHSGKQSEAVARIRQALLAQLSKATSTFVSVSRVEKGEFGQDGIASDIYKIAQDARDMGWLKLLIFDERSFRQSTGKTRPGEIKRITAIVVHLKPASESQRSDPSVFLACRLPLSTAVQETLDPVPRNWTWLCQCESDANDEQSDDEQSDDQRSDDSECAGPPQLPQGLSEAIPLYNSFGTIFKDDAGFKNAERTLGMALNAIPLPSELKQRIKYFLDQHSPLEVLTEAPAELSQSKGRIDVISLIPLTPDQLRYTQQSIEEAVRRAHTSEPSRWSGEVVLHRWKSHYPANRRDVMSLIKRALDNNLSPFFYICFFLVELPTPKEQKLVCAQWAYDRPILLQHDSVAEALKHWALRFDGDDSSIVRQLLYANETLQDGNSVQRLLDPMAAFPPDPPPWLPAVADDCGAPFCSPVFYLTRKLSEQQDQAIQDELSTVSLLDKGPKKYCMAAWGGNEDGGLEDMWFLLKRALSFRGGRVPTPGQAIFIDRDSPKDKSVILARNR